MKKLIQLFGIGSLIFSTAACSNDTLTEPTFTPDGTALKNLYANNLAAITQHDTFDASQTFTFTSAKGVKVVIQGSCLKKQNGAPVTGEVDFSYVEIFDRGTMLATNKPTVGIQNGEPKLLTSGGEFLVKVSQNNEELQTSCGYSIHAPTSLTGGTDPEMEAFAGAIDNDGNLTWESITQNTEMWTGFNQSVNADAYNVIFNAFDWFNYDKFLNLGQGFTSVTFVTPAGFNNSNSSVFMATKTRPNSLAFASTKMPIGSEVYYILVAEFNNGFKYAVKPVSTITPNQTITFTYAELQNGTIQQVIDGINDLP
ncbi:hypothetical protein [Sphingobacterium bovistauri]|uniref:DUF5017 domain-containing protein n=1 Tax=Sphingobacterium bovistauri TaxID=2781959 RepID=A0ABS7Z8P8_9SPHI|nr:hypothetical protein [Sphingobacterium bovistauri]MCA5006586.1 hypothetical protein [Sphingobacterium bovistauri]